MSAGRWIALAVAGTLSALASLAAFAPASLADLALDRLSLGRARLAEAEGTLWNGSARLVLTDAPGTESAGGALRGFAFPGTFRWKLGALPLVFGLVDATVSVDGAGAPVRLSGQPSDLRVSAGEMHLPGVELSRLGSPWNTIRPSSAVSLQWPSLAVRQGVLDGQFALELRDVAAAIVPVRPLGSYRIEVRGDGRDVKLGLSTLSGALSLDGQGSWDRRQGLRFEAQARATDDNRVRLQSLLTLIGRREGDRTVIRIGG